MFSAKRYNFSRPDGAEVRGYVLGGGYTGDNKEKGGLTGVVGKRGFQGKFSDRWGVRGIQGIHNVAKLYFSETSYFLILKKKCINLSFCRRQ